MEIKYRDLHRIASTAIICKENRYLIVKRSPNCKVFPGKWTVPGGGLEVDDYINNPKTSNDAWYFAIEGSLRREVKEEVSLEIADIKYLCDLAFIKPNGTPVIVLSYYCKWKQGEVILNEENTEYKWVSLKEAEKYDLISGIFEEICMAEKMLKGKEINKKTLKNNINNKHGS